MQKETVDQVAPTMRLAFNPAGRETLKHTAPTVRLALTIEGGGAMRPANLIKASHTTEKPALLVSYVYLDPFLKNQKQFHYRDWVLDSGAFSAHNSGREIKLDDYIDTAKRLLEEDQTLTEVFALDVIGDHKASLKNCERMWKKGVAAIPTFHRGSDERDLKHIAKDYPKIALGGVAMLRGSAKMDWAKQCFARVWPCRIHGFGFGAESQIMTLPFHSVDATNWEVGPCKFGSWRAFGKMSVRGSNHNLKAEVEHYLRIERKAQDKWRKEMAQLKTLGPMLRLSVSIQVETQVRRSGLT